MNADNALPPRQSPLPLALLRALLLLYLPLHQPQQPLVFILRPLHRLNPSLTPGRPLALPCALLPAPLFGPLLELQRLQLRIILLGLQLRPPIPPQIRQFVIHQHQPLEAGRDDTPLRLKRSTMNCSWRRWIQIEPTISVSTMIMML